MRWIVFDVGNVIVKADHAIGCKILIKNGLTAAQARQFFECEQMEAFAKGKLTQKQVHVALQKLFKCKIALSTLKQAYKAHIYGLDKTVVNILQTFPRKNIAILTDDNAWQEERVEELIKLKKHAVKVFQSWRMGMLKKEKGTFAYVLKQLQCKGKDVLFIDDTPEKIRMAKKVGINTILFKNAKQLKQELVKRKLL